MTEAPEPPPSAAPGPGGSPGVRPERPTSPTAGVRAVGAFLHRVDLATRPDHPAAAVTRRGWLRWLPAAALLAVLLPTSWRLLADGYGVESAVALALALVQTVPLLWSALRPLQAWCVAFCGDVAGAVVTAFSARAAATGTPWPFPPTALLGLLFLLAPLGFRHRRRTLVAVWLTLATAGWASELFLPSVDHSSWVLLVVLAGLVLAVGGLWRERTESSRRLQEQESISEEERARRTLLEERTRIARELHDVVAHHMSVITVQADSAPYRLPGLDPTAGEEFASIAATARESLTEMRRLLGVLRNTENDGADAPERSPQPGLEQLPRLVEGTVRAGVPVELTMPTTPPALPQAVGLSVYRIVQEALANVVRHAPASRATVAVESEDDGTLSVLVVNTAAPGKTAPLESSGTGHGLVGMRERIRLLDGMLDTGPLPDGGFRVAARLPTR
ncbi:sensor histidine kinase [Streptomyces sp. NPDC059740]|uniref:sensor histidine kinase n=1 Tax=Streptomyces sp. NPDC059740 TaxID=3346926 RepID=UPI0036508C0B